ncbi:mannitol dehydrogenase family protein [Streptomyces sp. NPDC059853]|uniref:mannitol dehydrogenase family protein n=1 Tax=Streptomyces sp. NPDC059853 TaxID=3346973 RepID=UPI0036642D8E
MNTTARPPLSRATAHRLPPPLRPVIDPGAPGRTRVVHFGIGAFHRAHQAVYTEHAAARSGEPWGITAVAPSSLEVVRTLRAQDGLYSVTAQHPDGPRTRVIASLTGALAMGPDADRVDALLADPEVTVVTLTITEKGYHARAGTLDTTAPAVAADLAASGDPARLRTVIGRLAAGIAARMRTSAAPLTVVSCDNVAGNGTVLAAVVRAFTEAADWPDRHTVLDRMATAVAFPVTVVDRIVPAPAPADREHAATALGLTDALPVTAEPYRQWVLQDSFTAPRPPWELDGALFVPDPSPYQLTKLRLLNGAHSALAYLGTAAGATTVDGALATDWGEPLVRALCAEVAPTLPPGGPDPTGYAASLVTRFRNPAMGHRLSQIGSDGSLKIPERWLPALRDLRAAGHATPVLELALAGWAHATRPGSPTTDPAATTLAACHRPDDPTATVRALLDALGAPDLAGDPALTAAVAARLPALRAGRVEI